MQNKMFRKGEISAVDNDKGMVRVVYPDLDNMVSDWLPILVQYSEYHSQSFMYSVGQTVYTLHIPEMLEQGVVIGGPMREGITQDTVQDKYNDGGMYQYNSSTGTLTLKGISKIIIDSPTVEITGDLVVKGTTTTSDSIVLDTHKHDGVTSGGSKTGGPL